MWGENKTKTKFCVLIPETTRRLPCRFQDPQDWGKSPSGPQPSSCCNPSYTSSRRGDPSYSYVLLLPNGNAAAVVNHEIWYADGLRRRLLRKDVWPQGSTCRLRTTDLTPENKTTIATLKNMRESHKEPTPVPTIWKAASLLLLPCNYRSSKWRWKQKLYSLDVISRVVSNNPTTKFCL